MSRTTLTPRQEHARHLAQIKELYGQYNRRFTFTEALTWIEDVKYYLNEGYPLETAAQYAYDHYHVSRQVKRGIFRSRHEA